MRERLKRIIRAWVAFLNRQADAAMSRAMIWSIRSGSRREFKRRGCHLSRDEIQAIKAYWRPFTRRNRPFFQGLYSCMHGRFDVRYLPDDLYLTTVMNHLNDRRYAVLTNKCLQPLLFDCRQPETLFMRMNGFFYDESYRVISRDEAIGRFLLAGEAVFKPATRTHSGRGIQFLSTDQREEVSAFLDRHFESIDSYMVQKLVRQHPDLAAIYDQSVNCLRVMTFLTGDGAVVLSSVLKMGAGGSRVDNLGFGGIVAGIRDDGTLREVAFAANGDVCDRHPQGFDFRGFQVPSFEKVKALAVRMAERIPYTRLIAWDIAVGEDGEPVLIEYNDIGELGFMQYANGPLFGDYTDRLLSEVFLA